MKGIIAVPTSSHFYLIKKFALDLMELRLALDKLGMDVTFVFSEYAWIEDARNSIWKKAKKINPDWMLWIDSDMTFTPRDAVRITSYIANGTHDFVTGIYFAGAQPHLPLIYKDVEVEYNSKKVKSISYYVDHEKQGEFFEIAACGFGFCAMSNKILNTLGDYPFKRLSSWFGEDIPENNLGEDLSFCKRAKDAGFKIYCDSSVQPGHIRQAVVNRELLKQDGFTYVI